MTKAQIVQRLLDEKLITAEEAVILLTPPQYYSTPTPVQPYTPPTYPITSPFIYGTITTT